MADEPERGFSATTSVPNRKVVTIHHVPEPDPEYATVLLRIRTPDGYFELEMGSGDAQRFGHALNNAGGGVLADR